MRRDRSQSPLLGFRRPSLAGSGLPERLRSTTVALLGLVAAAGLAMVAVLLQQGFPLVGSGPLPQPAAERERALDSAVAKRVPVPPRQVAPAPHREDGADRAGAQDAAPAAATPTPSPSGGSTAPSHPVEPDPGPVLVTGSRPTEQGERRRGDDRPAPAPVAAKPPVPPPQAAPVAPPPSATSSETPEPVPEPAPEPAPAPAPPPHPGNGNAYGKGNGNGVGVGGTPPGHAP